MIQRYDTTQQKRVDVSQIRRYDGSNWVDVSFVRRYDSSTGKWVDCLNDYEFTSYTHESPGGAVEVISADCSMVTITVPDNNFGGNGFIFKTAVPANEVGKEINITFTVNASYSGTVENNALGVASVTMESNTGGSFGGIQLDSEQILDNGNDVVYSGYRAELPDVKHLAFSFAFYYELTSGKTLTFTVKDVLINGKPCKFSF